MLQSPRLTVELSCVRVVAQLVVSHRDVVGALPAVARGRRVDLCLSDGARDSNIGVIHHHDVR